MAPASVVAFDDSAEFNSNINLGSVTTLYTVPAGTTATLRGIVLLVPEPAGVGLISVAVGMLGRRRNFRARP
jgi:hypothetical protein